MTLGRIEKHYRVCLSADASGRKDAAAAILLHSQVRPTAVQGLLACGVKNAQSASAAREHWDRLYRTSGHRAATDGILKGISVCTVCVEAPERPPSALTGTEPWGPELHGVPLAALKRQHPLGERRRPPPSLASLAAEDLVDMSTDDLKERYKRTVTMAGMMAYTLTEDREEELPVTGAWTMIKKRELASFRVCCVMYIMYVPFFCLPTRLRSCFRLLCAFAVSSTFPQGNNGRSVCFRCRWQRILRQLGAQPSCVRHPRLGNPIYRARSRTTTTTITSTTNTTPTNTTINPNPNPKSGCWSRSPSRTSRWSRSGRSGRSGGARRRRCSREKRKRGTGGSSTSDHMYPS